MEDVGIFHGHLVYLRPFGISILWSFGIFFHVNEKKSGNCVCTSGNELELRTWVYIISNYKTSKAKMSQNY
jgi:hypothetical protein